MAAYHRCLRWSVIQTRSRPQGTLRRVAAEVEVQVRELTALLKERVMAQSDDAAECIGLIRRLGGPVADLQVPTLPVWLLDGQQRIDGARARVSP
jgi:hypothetical protein